MGSFFVEIKRKKIYIRALNRHFFQTSASTIGETGGDIIYQIYLDSYFVLNFWMNLWVLFLCKKRLDSRVSFRRMTGVALVSTLFQCLILILPFPHGYIKLILGYTILEAASLRFLFRPESKEQFGRIMVTALLGAIALGGGIQAVEYYLFPSGLTLVNLLGITGLLGLLLVWLGNKAGSARTERMVKVKLFFSPAMFCTVNALVDSGNSLVDPISGKAVSLVEKAALEGFYDQLQPNRFRAIPYHSIDCQEGLLEAYGIEKLQIRRLGGWKSIKDPLIGVVGGGLSMKETYQMILHPALLEN